MAVVYINLHPRYDYATAIIGKGYVDIREYVRHVDWLSWQLKKPTQIWIQGKIANDNVDPVHLKRAAAFAQRLADAGVTVWVRDERGDEWSSFESQELTETELQEIECERCWTDDKMKWALEDVEKYTKYVKMAKEEEHRRILQEYLEDARARVSECKEAEKERQARVRAVWKEQYMTNEISNKEYVWYACYGSNINRARFMRYIDGCSDTTPPVEDRPFELPYSIYFAASSVRWENKAVAFLDDSRTGHALGRIYKISREQYDEVKLQEGVKYTKQVELGEVDGLPVYTFTDVEVRSDRGEPSEAYFCTILEGLVEVYPERDEKELRAYLMGGIEKSKT